MGRQRKTHLNPSPSPALQPPAQPQPQPAPRRKKSYQTLGSYPGSFKDKKKDDFATSWPTSQDTRILSECPLSLFNLIEDHIHHRIKKSVTNFRKPSEVGLELAITLRHLATAETYTLQFHWLYVGWLYHHLQICLPGLLSHPCGIPGSIFALAR